MLEMILGVASKKYLPPTENGFVGELTNNQFISYESISTLTGVTNGTLQNEGSGWLLFNLDDKTLVVAKKNIRYNLTWNQIHSKGCIFGTRIVTINGAHYKVRVLKGTDTDPSPAVTGNYVEGSHNSEWSQLFYPLVSDDPHLPSEVVNPEAPYSSEELGFVGTPTRSWCQEGSLVIKDRRITRGYGAATHLYYNTPGTSHGSRAWRPCLELIP